MVLNQPYLDPIEIGIRIRITVSVLPYGDHEAGERRLQNGRSQSISHAACRKAKFDRMHQLSHQLTPPIEIYGIPEIMKLNDEKPILRDS